MCCSRGVAACCSQAWVESGSHLCTPAPCSHLLAGLPPACRRKPSMPPSHHTSSPHCYLASHSLNHSGKPSLFPNSLQLLLPDTPSQARSHHPSREATDDKGREVVGSGQEAPDDTQNWTSLFDKQKPWVSPQRRQLWCKDSKG